MESNSSLPRVQALEEAFAASLLRVEKLEAAILAKLSTKSCVGDKHAQLLTYSSDSSTGRMWVCYNCGREEEAYPRAPLA